MTEESLELTRLMEFTIERAPDPVFWITQDGRFAHVNTAACEFLGYSRDQLQQMSVCDIDPNFPAQRWPAHWKELQEKGSLFFETIHRTRDGRLVPVEIRVNYLEFAGRKYNVAFSRDISERKASQGELEAFRRFLLTAMDAIPDGIIVIDRNHRVVLTNRAARESAGGIDPAALGLNCYQFSHRREAPCVGPDDVCPLTEVMRTKAPTVVHHRHYDALGREHIVELTAAPILDSTGEVVQMIEACRDVTARVQAEDALRKERAFLRKIIDAAPGFVGVKDIEGRFVMANRALADAYGTTAENIVGKTDADFNAHPDEVARFLQADRQVILSQQDLYIPEETVTDTQGRQRYLTTWKIPLLEDDGTCHQVLLVTNDISELRQANEALRRVGEDLRRSNQDLQEFAYVASHDLQEPLRMIRGHLQLVERLADSLNNDAQECLRYAIDGAVRMQTLIVDLLAYSRAGTQTQKAQLVDVKGVVDQALGNLAAVVDEARAIITIGPLPRVRTDARQLGQVFQNLIGNALKYRRKDLDPQIEIGAEREEGRWRFWVKDNGIGIAPEFHDRIFQVFQRLHTRQEYPGTGIGLAICRKIVERGGGKIWAASQPGQGSTFLFSLPTHDE